MGIFTVNHSKLRIDTTVDGIEGPAGPPWPKGDKGDTGSKRDKGDRGLNTNAQGAKDDVGAQGLSGSGDSVDLSTVLLLDGTQIMTDNLHMNSKRVVSLGNPMVQWMPVTKSMLVPLQTTYWVALRLPKVI